MDVLGMKEEGQTSNIDSNMNQKIIIIKGLDNWGNICYMNCCLQVLYSTFEFREYILSEKCPTNALHSSLNKLFKAMDTKDDIKSIEPKDFWKTFTYIKPEFQASDQQHDAHECLRFIVDVLHEEVNRANKRDKHNIKTIRNGVEAWEQYNKYMDDSYYVSLFVGQLKSTIECDECHNRSDSWDHFWDISIPFPEKDEECDVSQCLTLFIKEEIMDTDSMPECSQCKVKRKSTKKLTLEREPLILIIQLKRFGNNGQKIHKKITINENLLINGSNYCLYAYITHRGCSSSGHYTSHCKHLDQWFFFDDEEATEVTKIDLCESTDAYILFYRIEGLTADPNV